MRYYQIETAKDRMLNEVRMAPSNLNQFLQTPLAKSMRAGFEAELIFSDVLDQENYDSDLERDDDADEPVYSINDIIEFFSNGEYANMSSDGRTARNLREEMRQEFSEWRYEQLMEDFENQAERLIMNWLIENELDEDDMIEEILSDEMDLSSKEVAAAMLAGKRFQEKYYGNVNFGDEERDRISKQNKAFNNYKIASDKALEKLHARIAQEIEERGSAWENAWEEFEIDNDSAYDQEAWLDSKGITYASDAEGEWSDLYWPHYNEIGGGSGEFNESVADDLASSLKRNLGVPVAVGGYHGVTRDDKTWIFEPDSSLESGAEEDMPVEIVSPPMPLPDAVAMLSKFFAWARGKGAYANESTGFHMSVSLPDHDRGSVDFAKLALFLGDRYVLEAFNREANIYCKSAIDKIKNKVSPNNIDLIFDTMRKGLSQIASKILVDSGGFDKYTSINPKQNYIEFRSAGGENYFADMAKIQNTMIRYAYAMSIASEPNLERQEYAKKLYKMLSSTQTANTDMIQLFSRYAAGELSAEALKTNLMRAQRIRTIQKAQPGQPIHWRVTTGGGAAAETKTVLANTEQEAKQKAATALGIPASFTKNWTVEPVDSNDLVGDELAQVNKQQLWPFPTDGRPE